MDSKDFVLEEYKQLNAEKLQIRESYIRLERVTFAGVAIIYGFLLLNIEKITQYAWLIVPILVLISAIRSFSYYYVINWKLDTYIALIESGFYGTVNPSILPGGYQNWHNKKSPSRIANIVVNSICWALLLIVALAATAWRFGYYNASNICIEQ